MKKILILLIITNYLYAIPTCKNNESNFICYYKGPLSRSIIITNMENNPIFFNVKIIKNNFQTIYDLKNVKIGAYQKFKIEEKFYFKNNSVIDENLRAVYSYNKNSTNGKSYIYKDKHQIIDKKDKKYKLTKKILSRVENIPINKTIGKSIKQSYKKSYIITEKETTQRKKYIEPKVKKIEINKNLNDKEINDILNKNMKRVIKQQNKKEITKRIIKKVNNNYKKTNKRKENESPVIILLFITLIVTIIIIFISVKIFRKTKYKKEEDINLF